MDKTQKVIFAVATVWTLALQLEAVTVDQPLCPTNKIAPHRRAVSWEQTRPRTLGLIYNLITPGQTRPPPINNLHDLQEQPQADDPNDCGEIEDYDETDLSSITPGANNKVSSNRRTRFFFGDSHIVPSSQPAINRPRPPYRPTTPRPLRPTHRPVRPPYSSGGIFESNVYRPQENYYPSNNIKPVQENTYENPQTSYSPGLVGGAIGHVVGFQPVIATSHDRVTQTRPNAHIRFPGNEEYTRRPVRREQANVATGIIGSFVDLLFH